MTYVSVRLHYVCNLVICIATRIACSPCPATGRVEVDEADRGDKDTLRDMSDDYVVT